MSHRGRGTKKCRKSVTYYLNDPLMFNSRLNGVTHAIKGADISLQALKIIGCFF
jgi:hypothetical protein